MWAEMSGDAIGGSDSPVQLFTHAGEQRVHFAEEGFRGKAAKVGIPHPLVSHRAGTAQDLLGVRNTAQRRSDHVAVLKGADELVAFGGIVAEAVQQFRAAPL